MRLSQLVSGFTVTPPGADPEIVGLSEDSRRIERGMLFVAVPGTALDGHAYIGDAVARGAAAIVAERTGAIPTGIPAVRVPSSRDALALLASRFFSTTSTPLSLLGFTGTFGKTSTERHPAAAPRCRRPADRRPGLARRPLQGLPRSR